MINIKGGIPIDNQTKKAQLQRYRNCEREITRIEEEIERWESRAEKITASYHAMPGGGGGDRIQTAVDEITELRAMLYDKLAEATETRREIERAIQSVDDERLRVLLEYRYIDGMTWEKISVTLHYDIAGKNVYKMHELALGKLKLDTQLHPKRVI